MSGHDIAAPHEPDPTSLLKRVGKEPTPGLPARTSPGPNQSKVTCLWTGWASSTSPVQPLIDAKALPFSAVRPLGREPG
jgi:hypothetical protein